ncbi:MAG: hypothetical protein Ta2B_15160 [Termitinemataceae bacterium]|nr:MAG: hypothetical protein Ta2B_15160 [Termitinemataceae bacterium]
MAVPSEPLSEDDFTPEVQIVSCELSDPNGEKTSINYIHEKELEDFRPLNVQEKTIDN